MIVDTDFVIDVMNGDGGALAKASEMDETGTVQRVPAVVVYELFVGAGYTDQPDAEVRKIEAVVASKPFVPMNEAISRKAGRIKGRLKAAGTDVGMGDTMVGATGVVLDEPVLTRNAEEFERIPGLEVVTY